MTFRAVKDGRIVTRDSQEDGECIHGMGLDLPCTSCLNQEAKRDKYSHLEHVFNAQFEGTCPDCGGPINVGDEIAKHDRMGYVHFVCS